MKKLLIIATVCLVFATESCKKEQQIQPNGKGTSQAENPAQTTYNYQQAIMAKHTIIK